MAILELNLSNLSVSHSSKFPLSICVNIPLQRFAELHDMSFIEASARHNLYVAEVFNTLVQQMYEHKKKIETPNQKDKNQNITIPSTSPEQDKNDRKSACKC